jgi:hypothetical protein
MILQISDNFAEKKGQRIDTISIEAKPKSRANRSYWLIDEDKRLILWDAAAQANRMSASGNF